MASAVVEDVVEDIVEETAAVSTRKRGPRSKPSSNYGRLHQSKDALMEDKVIANKTDDAGNLTGEVDDKVNFIPFHLVGLNGDIYLWARTKWEASFLCLQNSGLFPKFKVQRADDVKKGRERKINVDEAVMLYNVVATGQAAILEKILLALPHLRQYAPVKMGGNGQDYPEDIVKAPKFATLLEIFKSVA